MKAAMDLSDKVKNEQFREYCYIGDLDLVKNFYRQEAPDVNSQNKMNGWTVLHWAAKQNHVHVVEYLLSVGANPDTRNNNGKLAAELTQNADVRKLLKFEPTAEIIEEASNPSANKFVPNFKRHPDFHYANKGLYTDPNQTKKTPQVDPSLKLQSNIPSQKLQEPLTLVEATNNDVLVSDADIITIKARAHGDEDFVELDIDKRMTFVEFKAACISELDHIEKDTPVFKIRKLPNVLVRKTADIKRIKPDQEIEFIFGKS